MKNYKLDIFDLLSQLNSDKISDIYENLSDEEKKGFSPLIVMRWMSGTSDARQIMLLNEYVNPSVFALAKHPHLLMQMLHTVSSKMPKKYYWLATKGGKKSVEAVNVVAKYFDMSVREARLLKPFPEACELIDMATELGYQNDDLIKLKKELCVK